AARSPGPPSPGPRRRSPRTRPKPTRPDRRSPRPRALNRAAAAPTGASPRRSRARPLCRSPATVSPRREPLARGSAYRPRISLPEYRGARRALPNWLVVAVHHRVHLTVAPLQRFALKKDDESWPLRFRQRPRKGRLRARNRVQRVGPDVRRGRLAVGQEVEVGARDERVDPMGRRRVRADVARDALVVLVPERVLDNLLTARLGGLHERAEERERRQRHDSDGRPAERRHPDARERSAAKQAKRWEQLDV